MKEYHKIQTIFKRDPATKHKTLLEDNYSLPPELCRYPWVFTEKVDGTNIRVYCDEEAIRFAGKSDNAQIPVPLVKALNELFCDRYAAMLDMFGGPNVCLYGEGYGPGIQNGGKYRSEPSFVLFDVWVDGWWLKREAVNDIASKLGISVVPIIGEGTLNDMVKFVQEGFHSRWGQFMAEGVVARPKVELMTRGGERIITKLKSKDFQ